MSSIPDDTVDRITKIQNRLRIIDEFAERHWKKLEFTVMANSLENDGDGYAEYHTQCIPTKVSPGDRFEFVLNDKVKLLEPCLTTTNRLKVSLAIERFGPANASLIARNTGLSYKSALYWIKKLGYGNNKYERRAFTFAR